MDKVYREVPPISALSKSMEWVYHDRGIGVDLSLVRKYQKECWDRLFGHFKGNSKSISYVLNTQFMPVGSELVAFDVTAPEEFLQRAQDLLQNTEYDIHILIKPKKGLRTASERY